MHGVRSGWNAPWGVSTFVALVAVAAYANTLTHGFVFDDVRNIVQNPWIRDARFLGDIFSTHAAGFDPGYSTSFYRPVMHLVNLLAYATFGMAPWGFHLVNVLLHAGVSILTLWIATCMWREFCAAEPAQERHAGPLFVALVFALHPVHTEAVAWLAGITDISYAFFGLLALHLFVTSSRPLGSRNLLASASYLAATLAKEPAVVLPVALLAYETLRGRRPPHWPTRESLMRLLPFVAATGLYVAARLHALGGVAPNVVDRELGPGGAVVNGAVLLARYLWTMVWPTHLSALHAFRPVTSPLEWRTLLAAAVVAGVVLLAGWARRRPLVLFGLVMTVLPLLPALYIPALGTGVFAERYLYLPVFGFGLVVAPLFVRPAPFRRITVVRLTASALLLAVYGVATVDRNRVWRDGLSLWTDAVAKDPASAAAHEYLGFALYSAGRIEEAIDSYQRALALDAGRADAHLNLGVAFATRGRLAEAISAYEQALRLRPNSAEARSSLGLALVDGGRLERGLVELRAAVALNPTLPSAHNNLGAALARSGRLAEAEQRFAEAVALDPTNQTYRENLDRARALLGARPIRR